MTSAITGSICAQNGHWKSANSTIITGASGGPRPGPVGSIGNLSGSMRLEAWYLARSDFR